MDQNKVKSEEPKVLLTQGEDGKLKVITGEQDGKLKTVEPTKENADQFLKVDTNSNFLENFFKKMSAQFNHPSHTGVYAVGMSAVDKIAAFLGKLIRIDHSDKALDPYRLKFDGKVKIHIELTGKFQPLDLNKIDWKESEKLGLSGDKLQDALKAMVYGHKSPGLVDIKPIIDGNEFPMQARLSLEPQKDGSIKLVTHPKQEQPDFDKPFMGVAFSEQDKEQLQKTGHGARVFELEVNGEKIPSVISLDKLTNRLEAVPLSEINIPQTLKNAPLSPEQQQGLKEGKAVWVEGMDKKVKPGEEPQKIDRFVQFNAVNKNFDFKFSDEQRQQHNQQRQAKQGERPEKPLPKARKMDEVWVYSKQGGVQLSKEEFTKLCNKEPIFVEGMQSRPKPQPDASGSQKVEATDQKGQKYNAWVWIDENKGKVRHTSKHPDQMRAIEAKQAAKDSQKVTPAAESKTQVAVNNEGKTNEATKHSKEPLKQGQTQPTAKQVEKKEQKQQEQKQSPAAPKKSKGRKM
ncbi:MULTISPECIES: DUF3945 domain-containing protein [Dysgonomonas]|uniref:DUF3945 domain-containing protein n=1 Tax=Dysgonomonas TaxID=156973 RepID=UPI000927694C|nr:MULTISPECIES: DUF3945 domain-containing protein [Dysgonomonas]MBN9302520.1 DUF3945 domain-containing protein [Dysgonomonas mossii]OJX59499.1 MAG: hypothetical protein BGO84_12160 [Dysgonomonas sp. 37-18]